MVLMERAALECYFEELSLKRGFNRLLNLIWRTRGNFLSFCDCPPLAGDYTVSCNPLLLRREPATFLSPRPPSNKAEAEILCSDVILIDFGMIFSHSNCHFKGNFQCWLLLTLPIQFPTKNGKQKQSYIIYYGKTVILNILCIMLLTVMLS